MKEIYNLRDVDMIANTFVNIEDTASISVARAYYTQLVIDYPELMTVLYSVADEVFKPFSTSRRAAKPNRHINMLPQALGDILYAVNNGTTPDSSTVIQYDMAVKIICDFVTSKRIQTIAGTTWTASIIPDLLGLPKLIAEYVILPDFITRKDISVQDLSTPTRLDTIKFPAYLFATENKGKGKLCYFIMDEGVVQSNINFFSVRDYLTETFKVDKFGVIGYLSRAKNITTYQPICSSFHTQAIKKLYQGKNQDTTHLDFDMKTIFRRAKSTPTMKIKIPSLKLLENQQDFIHSIKSWTKRRVQVMISPKVGAIKLEINRLVKRIPIVDFILSKEYLPLGIVANYKGSHVKIYCNVPDDIIQRGIIDAFIEVRLEFYHGRVLRGSLIRFMDSNYHSCDSCGLVSAQKLCKGCYDNLRAVVNGTLENQVKFDSRVQHRKFSIRIKDYLIEGEDNSIIFTREPDKFKGQRGLPLFPAVLEL